jgi:hypothetical protein
MVVAVPIMAVGILIMLVGAVTLGLGYFILDFQKHHGKNLLEKFHAFCYNI